MRLDRRFELLTVVLLLYAGVGMPVAAVADAPTLSDMVGGIRRTTSPASADLVGNTETAGAVSTDFETGRDAGGGPLDGPPAASLR